MWRAAARPTAKAPGVRVLVGLGREDPGTGVRGAARVVPVDEDGVDARADQLVGGGTPDQPTADDHAVSGRSRRGCLAVSHGPPP